MPGDLIHLESGDNIPADARLTQTVRFSTQEAALTGESDVAQKSATAAVREHAPLAERRSMVYAGTSVASGKAAAVVVATGMQTELGQIAGLLEKQQPQSTPLERRLDQLGKVLLTVCIGLVAIIFSLDVWRGGDLLQVFLLAVSLAVAAVPEGLPAVVTMSLALGLERMVKRHAIVRKLASVETLGSVTIICSDKTGTLTRNQMTVRELIVGDFHYRLTGEGFNPSGEFSKTLVGQRATSDFARLDSSQDADLLAALRGAVRCTTATLAKSPDQGTWTVLGDPTEGALLTAARKAGIDLDRDALPVLHEIPFESDRKAMSLVVAVDEAQKMYTKGAPEVILARSTHEQRNGQRYALDDARRLELANLAAEFAGRAMRVLGIAMRDYPAAYGGPYDETELTFLALIAMLDPPREEAKLAVERCHAAGVRAVMITGDHPDTAIAVARELRITSSDRIMTGDAIDELGDEQLQLRAGEISVYARVSAQHKKRIVDALKASGQIVAMTGDGVNDAPAVAAADIGIAMGLTGTDVTKDASDMVLTDDNFASIVNAVEEGRAIYDNIKRVVQYLLSTNAGEVLFMFFAALVGWPLPLLPIQLLWINLVTDGLPALALGMEPPGPGIMSRPPRPATEPVITRSGALRIAFYGVLFALSMGLGFAWTRWHDPANVESAQTVAFCIACFAQVLFAFGCRSEHLVLPQLGPRSNLPLLLAIATSIALQLCTVLSPLGRRLFATTAMTVDQWFLVGVLSLFPVTVLEVSKLARRPWRG